MSGIDGNYSAGSASIAPRPDSKHPTAAITKTTERPDARPGRGINAGVAPLTLIADDAWQRLAERAIEPNGYFLPDWMRAINATANGRTNVGALTAWRGDHAIGLLPAISLWRAYRIPLPALVSADPYGTLGTPFLDCDAADDAAAQLLAQAKASGAHALILRDVAMEGHAIGAFTRLLARDDMRPRILQSHLRACLDATQDAEGLLRDALGAKKLKELRRQRSRMAEHGDVTFTIARSPNDVAQAVEVFLTLEASGWKAKRGTALIQHDGDATFIRSATAHLAARGQCDIVTLHAGATPVAAAVVIRHGARAFYFKLGVDERFAKFSPGVQLTLELTRQMCADPAIASVDSTAAPGHPMIDPIWRGRLAIGDVMIPLHRNDPVTAFIYASLTLRRLVRDAARRIVKRIRTFREKRP